MSPFRPDLSLPMLPRSLRAATLGVIAFLVPLTWAEAQARRTPTDAATRGIPATESVGRSPWGARDEIGTLNMMTDSSRAAVLGRVRGGRVYDLAVEYFNGMPSWYLAGDPLYQLWMTHSPRGHAIDDPLGVGAEQNAKVAYTGDAVSMYTHTGTHIDALNHFGLHGEIFNGFAADEHLGDRGWTKVGVEKFPPIIARGVLVDVAAYKGVTMLPDSYSITPEDLKGALARQGTQLRRGDVVLIRGGRMTAWPDVQKYVLNQPGLGLPGAKWLAEEVGVMAIGGDNLSLEHFPVHGKDNWIPVHSYLLAQRGIPIIEVVWLEDLARERVYEFAFVAGPLKLRGASAAPFRPVALPLGPGR
jgi:kynurenine formamidase